MGPVVRDLFRTRAKALHRNLQADAKPARFASLDVAGQRNLVVHKALNPTYGCRLANKKRKRAIKAAVAGLKHSHHIFGELSKAGGRKTDCLFAHSL